MSIRVGVVAIAIAGCSFAVIVNCVGADPVSGTNSASSSGSTSSSTGGSTSSSSGGTTSASSSGSTSSSSGGSSSGDGGSSSSSGGNADFDASAIPACDITTKQVFYATLDAASVVGGGASATGAATAIFRYDPTTNRLCGFITPTSFSIKNGHVHEGEAGFDGAGVFVVIPIVGKNDDSVHAIAGPLVRGGGSVASHLCDEGLYVDIHNGGNQSLRGQIKIRPEAPVNVVPDACPMP